ncbi:IS630 family transposase [Geomonas propionica]|uniref:IS630 family transposase n=1 Tax=Geomonas propionica TaxID=2798582 RepID=A0ABS0YQM6_9BACT|nr:IS630 family transposase [Geomonas propionica]MBJ6800215.1 IS630 family transposase [Geomonas propionica]
MDPRIRYCVELEKVRDLPDFQRIRAEARFLLVKEYLNVFLKHEAKRLGSEFRVNAATNDYCTIKNITLRTFYRWLRVYRDKGIEGLVPQYGNHSLKSGHNPQLKKKRTRYTLSVTIDIVTGKTLAPLVEVGKIIATSAFISKEAKAPFVHAFKRICDLASQRTPLKLQSSLLEDERHRLKRYQAGNHKKHSAKATAILMMSEGKSMLEIGLATNAAERTIYRWLHEFNAKRLDFIQTKPFSQARIDVRELRTTRIVDILHKMPSLYGINRSSWTYGAIAQAYQKEYGCPISKDILLRIIKGTGYSWKHARTVLTSPDPEYKAKVERILETLRGLVAGERFFFIDEVGPYKVKKYGGKYLGLEEQTRIIPAVQPSKGTVQFVASLEALSNQVTWLFTPSKGSEALIALLEELVTKHSTCTRIFLTWDAIGVHSSRLLKGWISQHNKMRVGPAIEVVPLPANSQFLNVIEAVFCGMKRAVICNSDYQSVKEMQDAIAQHFEERNQYYRDNPKRAGDKIWDREKFDLEKLVGGLFKKM